MFFSALPTPMLGPKTAGAKPGPSVQGIKSLKPKETTAYIAKNFDALLTTFDVLRKEIVFARKPAQRGLRNGRKISYKRCVVVPSTKHACESLTWTTY